MGNAFTYLLMYITEYLPAFLMSEPVVYFVGAFVLVFIIGLVLRLVHARY